MHELLINTSCSNDDDDTTIIDNLPDISNYPIIGTNQSIFFNSTGISALASGEAFYGQDAQYTREILQIM